MQRRTRRVVKPAVTRLWDIELSGYERLPVDGPAILCPNHISFLDSALLAFTMPRNISFAGKSEYMDSWRTRYLFPAMGMIPIDRSGGERSACALDAALGVLRRGELFGIYPEGTRSRDGRLHKGRTGAARLASQIGCPIFPVGIVGTDAIQPPGARMPKLRRTCSIIVGRPVSVQDHADHGPDHVAWRSTMDEVMSAIRGLTGQEYLHRYAGDGPDAPAGDATSCHDGSPTSSSTDRRKLVPSSG